MKKYVLLILFLVLVIGCSKVEKKNKNVSEIKPPIDLKFHGMNLLIDNPTDNNIVIFDSKTEFSTKKKGTWELEENNQSDLMITSSVLSKEKLEINLENTLSAIQSDEIKVTIYYSYGYDSEKSKAESIIYNKKKE